MTSILDLIVLMVLVFFIVTRLYSILGTKGDENVKIVIKPMNKEAEKELVENLVQIMDEREAKTAPVAEAVAVSAEDKSLAQIPDFNKEMFLNGARKVFEIILLAFGSGNLESTRDLMSKKVWDSLNFALLQRRENHLTSEVDFICFEKSEIKSVKLLKNSVRIVVEFVSQQVNILKNDKEEVIEGDENFVQKITDMWTFERALNAKNNRWILVSTKKTA